MTLRSISALRSDPTCHEELSPRYRKKLPTWKDHSTFLNRRDRWFTVIPWGQWTYGFCRGMKVCGRMHQHQLDEVHLLVDSALYSYFTLGCDLGSPNRSKTFPDVIYPSAD